MCFLQRQRISQEKRMEVDEKERGLVMAALFYVSKRE